MSIAETFYNGFRSVDVQLVLRFGGSPSGSPLVKNIETGVISCSSTQWVRCLAVPWVMLWRLLGSILRFGIPLKLVSRMSVFEALFMICSPSGLKPHDRGCVCINEYMYGIRMFWGLWYRTLAVFRGAVRRLPN